ncbi:MAG TPA: DinB family protein [Chloroflexia bacterium]|nr:DinB family protein [Chloroflexia bacterium]
MIDAEQLMAMYGLTYRVIKKRMEGLSHEDSLLQPPIPTANCLNWIMGHVMATRSNILALMGLPTVWEYGQAGRYISDSRPVDAKGEDALPLEEILEAFDQSQELLLGTLRTLSVDDLQAPTGDHGTQAVQTIGGQLAFYHFHESYHLGQIDALLPGIKAQKEGITATS